MKQLKLTIAALFFAAGAFAQLCDPILPANTLVLNKDTSFSYSNNGSILICPGVTFTGFGNSSMYTIFVEETASLVYDTAAYTYDSVWVKSPGTFDAADNQYQYAIYEPNATLIDTANGFYKIPCSDITYDYSLLPGGVSGCTTTGIKDKLPNSFLSVFPNPAANQLNISTSFTNYKVTLFNTIGENVYQSQNVRQIDLDYPAGIYFVRVESNGQTQTKKVILK